MMNEILLRKGYGTLDDLPPNVRYKERLWKAQEEAKLLGKGLWQK
jgi:endonuclease YncB( thermonuclease family)